MNIPIPAGQEDQQAPPSSDDAEDDEASEDENARPSTGAPLPPLAPLGPGGLAPQGGGVRGLPAGPGGSADPVPSLPGVFDRPRLSPPAGGGPGGAGPGGGARGGFSSTQPVPRYAPAARAKIQRVNHEQADQPPALPKSFGGIIRAGGTLPAGQPTGPAGQPTATPLSALPAAR